MGVLQRFERRIEEMVNRPFARAFKAEVQPVEIASALQRESTTGPRSWPAAARWCPTPSPSPSAATTTSGSSVYAEALGDELAVMVREHADEQGYAFIGPVTVDFERDDDLAHRPVPGAQRRRGGRHRGRAVHRGHRQPAARAASRGSRSAPRRTRWPGP